MSGAVHSEIDDGICTLTLENEGKRNAFTYSMIEEITERVGSLAERDDPPIIVFRGAGEKAFSAGFDLTQERVEVEPGEKRPFRLMTDAIDAYPYPTIAMINGDTYGGAVGVAVSCDLRVGVEGARFGVTPAKLGLVYGDHAIGCLVDLIGPAKTKEMLFTGEPFYADHAADVGLLNYVVERDELEPTTYDLAETMASNAPLSLTYMKEIVDAILERRSLSEAERQWVARLREEAYASEDHEEGVAAFSEGREPEFVGR